MRLSVMPVGTLVLIVAIPLPALSQDKPAKIGRVGCPHCVNDGSAISQSLQEQAPVAFRLNKESSGEFSQSA
jgi:hypothetical protein